MTFQEQIKQGIPAELPPTKPYPLDANRAPKRKNILTKAEKQLAVRNALRYFPKAWHAELAPEFAKELNDFGRIYMYRFKPDYELKARPITEYPANCQQAAAIMLMIDNNLDPAVAQHPQELITYGGNGAVFQNWAQYRLTMQYLSEMEGDQTLHMYSGHPMGLFPSSEDAPRVIVTNGMMIPNYSKPDDWERFNALGVTQYGQMTAGSYMYIGPQGIVHGTTITVMNAFRKVLQKGESAKGKIFLTAGLGGMSGAQPKAGNIAGYQTSLHNPWSGGYYPVGISYDEANRLIRDEPELFKAKVQATLKRHAEAVNKHTARGTYFFDYGNAFLLEASRAGGAVMADNGIDFKYPSYVQDILGPMCFDYGFGPFRWVCTSGKPEDLDKTDAIAAQVLERIMAEAPEEIQQQMQDNITWIKDAKQNKLVVGSQARILYADAEGRMEIAAAFNAAIARGEIGPVVLGRDHHDVSGTDSPFRETSNIYDGSRFTADMAIHNVIGDSFRGATWVSIHNGGGVGWGEVINGGFGLLLDGTSDADRRLKSMLLFDVNNGIARRSWARNTEADFAIKREMARTPKLKVTLANRVDDDLKQNRDYADQVAALLLDGETIIDAYKSMRDGVVFTTKRLIVVNVQGITGSKKDFTSIPYKNIVAYSVETSGTFDLDSELEIYLSAVGKVKFEFTGKTAIVEIAKYIAQHSL
ncbi:UNVERIFIED_CONTAM: uroc1 [Trichonephila clavipes]